MEDAKRVRFVSRYVSNDNRVVTEFFDKYPLKTQKLADYLLFREVVMMMKDKEHLTAEGLQEIINIKS